MQIQRPLLSSVAATPNTRGAARPTGASACDDVDYASDRIRTVERTGRPTKDLDPLDVVGGQAGEVEGASRLIYLYAIDQDLDVVALCSSQKQRGHTAERATFDERQPRYASQSIGHPGHTGRS